MILWVVLKKNAANVPERTSTCAPLRSALLNASKLPSFLLICCHWRNRSLSWCLVVLTLTACCFGWPLLGKGERGHREKVFSLWTLDGQNCQSPIASVQQTQSTLASHSAVPHGTNVTRINTNHAIRIANLFVWFVRKYDYQCQKQAENQNAKSGTSFSAPP